ncbi:SMP-30/gluconolactonase/LRE family protein [Paenibacillus hodogayensis]|uniref:SMP-30/gluconolactonase/LRE family protein n=1 Tax=Paenibacillus hodogayensis TaxID=279208 RepID=A0ABV5VRH8_9BACL
MAQAEILLDVKAALGEGPSWDERNGLLYWVDIDGKSLLTYDPATGEQTKATFGKKLGAAVPRQSGGIVLTLEDGFYAYEPGMDEPVLIGAPEGLSQVRFNDGKCDAAGRFWAGTASLTGGTEGALYCMDTDLSIRLVLDGISCSNGLAWSTDNQIMYYIDSPTRNIMAYDYDLSSGQISNPRVAIEVTEAGAVPDGMTIDEEGMIWVALWGGYGIRRWNPHTGELLLKVDVAAEQSSSCIFGGPEYRDLYITSARSGLTEARLADQPLAGGLFIYRNAGQGTPTYAFGG